jgi:mRNA interferase MazF
MISFQWDIVRVPFPFTDQLTSKKRPALVLSNQSFNAISEHTILAMITKRGQSNWPNDCNVQNWQEAGLKFPSWIRLKFFTLENSLIIDQLGVLHTQDIAEFKAMANPVLWHPQ